MLSALNQSVMSAENRRLNKRGQIQSKSHFVRVSGQFELSDFELAGLCCAHKTIYSFWLADRNAGLTTYILRREVIQCRLIPDSLLKMWQTFKQGFESFYDLKNFKKSNFTHRAPNDRIWMNYFWRDYSALPNYEFCIIMKNACFIFLTYIFY